MFGLTENVKQKYCVYKLQNAVNMMPEPDLIITPCIWLWGFYKHLLG